MPSLAVSFMQACLPSWSPRVFYRSSRWCPLLIFSCTYPCIIMSASLISSGWRTTWPKYDTSFSAWAYSARAFHQVFLPPIFGICQSFVRLFHHLIPSIVCNISFKMHVFSWWSLHYMSKLLHPIVKRLSRLICSILVLIWSWLKRLSILSI